VVKAASIFPQITPCNLITPNNSSLNARHHQAASSVSPQEITMEAGLMHGDVRKPSLMLVQNLS
jgi:hypothetical protein